MRSLSLVRLVPFLFAVASCGPSNPSTPADDAAPDGAAEAAVDAAPDASPPDASPPDASPDVSPPRDAAPDATPPDAAADATADAPAPMDARADATPDAPAPDAAQDVAPDATGRACGTRGTGPCPEGLFCNRPISAVCGEFDSPGVCDTIPTVCNRVFMPVCGCDGMTYSNACQAAAASVSVRANGECAASADAGPDAAPDAAAMCAAQDARGVGACAAFFGYAWNGTACVGVSGCSCEGTACRGLPTTPDACRAAYSGCDCRAVGCPAGRYCSACRAVGGVTYACIPTGAAC
jgi:hypothetical protein